MLRLFAALAAVVVLTAPSQARTTTEIFDRHAVSGSYNYGPVLASPRTNRIKAKRKKFKIVRAKIATPKPGTLGAYHKVIENESIGPLPIQGLGNIGGLQAHFIAKLAALRAAMPSGLSFSVVSGFRSHAEQARLHALKPRLAARPGRSNHERGLAADLKFVSRESAPWLHRNASKYGLRFPMSYEPWHIEPAGATRLAMKHRRRHYASAQ